MRTELDLIEAIAVANMDATSEVLGLRHVGYGICEKTREYGIEESGARIQVGNELHAVAWIGKGDVMTVGRHERHTETITLLYLRCQIAVQAFCRLQRVLGIEGAYDVWPLNIVVVEVHEHLVANARFVIEAATIGSHGRGDADPRCGIAGNFFLKSRPGCIRDLLPVLHGFLRLGLFLFDNDQTLGCLLILLSQILDSIIFIDGITTVFFLLFRLIFLRIITERRLLVDHVDFLLYPGNLGILFIDGHLREHLFCFFFTFFLGVLLGINLCCQVVTRFFVVRFLLLMVRQFLRQSLTLGLTIIQIRLPLLSRHLEEGLHLIEISTILLGLTLQFLEFLFRIIFIILCLI